MINHADLAIVGGGIMGLAHAWAAARRKHRVVVFERNLRATGASIRNFGMIWPIGQPHGELHQMAVRSRLLWLDLLKRTGLPHRADGSLHVVYREDEALVAQEFAELAPGLGYECAWLNRDQVLARSKAVQPVGLRGGLFSPIELTVDPLATIGALTDFLVQSGVALRLGSTVTRIDLPTIETASGELWRVTQAIVCSGEDFETLYPDTYAASGMTKVKLQMLRTGAQPAGWQLGPALAAGLTLRFYKAFEVCTSLKSLKKRIAEETPALDKLGIHGLVSQLSTGELTLGDSHEYGMTVDIFNKVEIDELMLHYISTFLAAPDLSIAQRWYGVYAKHPEMPYFTAEPAPGVQIVSSPGGSGMTLSFGIGEKTISSMAL